MLEINQIPARDLRTLVEQIGRLGVERELNVHRTTITRWLDGTVQIPGAKHQVIRMLLGDLPGTQGKWSGWKFQHGLLVSPGGDKFEAGQVMAIGLNRQRIAQLERDLVAARARAVLLEQGYPQAANDQRVRA